MAVKEFQKDGGGHNLPMISIIDDDESVRRALHGLMRSVGIAVNVFASAEEFLDSDRLRNTDCLILDVRLPGMSGLELQRHLETSHSDIPIIFITSHEDDELRARALNAGAVDYFLKPFNDEDLLDAIDAALKSNGFGKK
jgi:FixJ family two-component response regulator